MESIFHKAEPPDDTMPVAPPERVKTAGRREPTICRGIEQSVARVMTLPCGDEATEIEFNTVTKPSGIRFAEPHLYPVKGRGVPCLHNKPNCRKAIHNQKQTMSKAEQVRGKLKQVMLPNQWYSSEELMAATGYDSRVIYRALRTWIRNGLVRRRKQVNSLDIEYRLVRA